MFQKKDEMRTMGHFMRKKIWLWGINFAPPYTEEKDHQSGSVRVEPLWLSGVEPLWLSGSVV